METNGTIFKTHRPINPYMGKSFKIVTYQGDKEIHSSDIKIESQSELKTTLETIKRFNNAQEELFKAGYSQGSLLVQKLITM